MSFGHICTGVYHNPTKFQGYEVYYTAFVGHRQPETWEILRVDDKKALLHLELQTSYYFKIRAFNELGSGPFSQTFRLLTEMEEFPPEVRILNGDRLEVVPGDSVELTCTASGKPKPSLAWYQGEDSLDLLLESAGRSSSLTISVKSIVETTIFSCVARNSQGRDTAQVRVVVIGPGSPPDQIQYRLVDGINLDISWGEPSIKNGDILGYSIHYTDDPKADIEKWNVKLLDTEHTVLLQNLQPETTYTVMLRAFNQDGFGPFSSRFDIRTTTQTMEPHVFMYNQSYVEIPPGKSVTLTCVASGFPIPKLTWTRNAEELSTLSEAGRNGSMEITQTLVLEEVYESANFECNAVNAVGSDKAFAEVHVTGPGSAPQDIQMNVHDTVAELKWEEPLIPNGEILDYSIFVTTNQSLPLSEWDQYRVIGKQYVLKNLTPSKTYYVRINGNSDDGAGVLSEVLTFHAERSGVAAETSLQPSDPVFEVAPGSKVTISCTATGYPPPVVTWYRNYEYFGYGDFHKHPDNEELVISNFTINSATESCTLQCRAENPFGAHISNVTIRVLGPGSPPLNVRCIVYSTTIDLSWSEPAITNGLIKHYNVRYTKKDMMERDSWQTIMVPGNTFNHIINSLDPETEYLIQVNAVGEFGPGPMSKPLFVETGKEEKKPEVTLHPNSSHYRLPWGEEIKVNCCSSTFPEPVITWYRSTVQIADGPGCAALEVKVTESAFYECRAVNRIGVQTKGIEVKVEGVGLFVTKRCCGLPDLLHCICARITAERFALAVAPSPFHTVDTSIANSI
ncbi:unnamed protein product [Soboliphyme baturini]|uniref:protein-tyrosine-phosphatase n=1 Tax=Soboliphyme baturini TaxID=241478 RepID=A0A3P8AYL9_9BILA|nr:unnamed protein product [Soboliphyme baturini]